MLRAFISQRRTSLLAEAIKFLKDDAEGPNLIPEVLHGCTSEFVAQELPNYLVHKNIQWHHMCHYHGAVIVDLMEAELRKAKPMQRKSVWDQWNARLSTASFSSAFAASVLTNVNNL